MARTLKKGTRVSQPEKVETRSRRKRVRSLVPRTLDGREATGESGPNHKALFGVASPKVCDFSPSYRDPRQVAKIRKGYAVKPPKPTKAKKAMRVWPSAAGTYVNPNRDHSQSRRQKKAFRRKVAKLATLADLDKAA